MLVKVTLMIDTLVTIMFMSLNRHVRDGLFTIVYENMSLYNDKDREVFFYL